MKKYIFSVFGMTCLILQAHALPAGGQTPTAPATPKASDLRTVKNESFKRGEQLKYRIHYGVIDAGEANIEVTDEKKVLNERPTLHVVGHGVSKGAFDWFFKVRDRYESFIDEEAMAPMVFIRRVDEGGYKINQDQVYDNTRKQVKTNGKSYDVPSYTQDMLSAFYFARTLDFTNAKVGEIFSVNCFLDGEIWDLKIKFVGRETIKTDVGNVKCVKFRPIVQKGRIFKKEEDLNVWISDDKNHIPVRAQANLLIGSIKMDLSSYLNLANPLAKE